MNRTIEAILKLTAKLGNISAFDKLSGKLKDVDQKAKNFNRTQGNLARTNAAVYSSVMRYAAPAALAYGATRATKEYASVERRLSRIGINAEASRESMDKAMGEMRQIAQDIEAPIDNVVSGLESLIAAGKTLPEAMALLPSVARTAQAADADFSEMASTAEAIGSSFHIAAGGMERAFDIIAKGGKEGKFELKDMAQELPSLAPAFAALGYQGEDGLKRLTAALQVVRKEVGTSGEAATSLMDVLTKMESQTVTNNFKKKFGMNITKEMAKAKKGGEDTLEAFIRLSREAVKGDLSKLPQLFTDKQMLIGMRALINRTSELRGMFGLLGDAAGTVNSDIKRLNQDAQSDIDRLANSWERLKTSVGQGMVEFGVGQGMNAVANAVDEGVAFRAGLRKMRERGQITALQAFLAPTDPILTHNAKWLGGHRTEADRKAIAAYGEYAASRASAPDRPSGQMPVPYRRPEPLPSNIPMTAPNYDPKGPKRYTPFAAGASPRDAERQSMLALRSDPNGVADAIDTALSSGGQKAAEKLADGGQKAGENAGDAMAAKATSIGQAIGHSAAETFRAEAGAIMRQFGSQARGARTDERGANDL